MTLSKTFLASAAFNLLTCVNSHLVVTHPVPFDQASLNNSPLASDGSDFPCKFGGGYTDTVTQMNNFEVGQTNNLTFMGSAVHGGGSCQVSVTLDKNPTKQSQWKVIHSIIGGCPADVPGNLEDGSPTNTGDGLKSFSWTLPKGMPNGQYTMAWSWLNRIGNREFYMNCWPVQVTGGGSDNSVFDKLPDMFVANLPPQQCATPETFNFVYPDPGDSVETGAVTQTTFASTFVAGSSAGCASVTALGRGAGSAGTPAQATAPASGAGSASSATAGGMIGSSATNAASPSSATSNPGGVFAPGASSAAPTTMATSAAAAPAASTAASSPAAAAPSAPAAPAPAPASGSSGTSDSPPSVSCSTEGFFCVDSSNYGMCINGKARPQPVAAGTQCIDSAIDFAQKQVPPGTKKREMSKYARHFPPHAHMHRRNALGYDF